MRVTRVHVDMALVAGAQIALPAGAAVHLSRVLRLGAGDDFVLFNGDGWDYPSRILAVGKRDSLVAVGPPIESIRESALRIVLLQGIARGEKMDLILQKACELGVSDVHPVFSQRTEVKLDEARTGKRHAHWQAVMIAACEQSGRARVPSVRVPGSLAAGLTAVPAGGLRLTLDPEGALSFNTLELAPEARVVLAVGPEGGWSPLDRQQLQRCGFQGLRLGPRILRTETAGIAAIAALQARFGDMA